MRFYVTWAFQRTPPLGSHITSDNTGILSWLNWEEGPSPHSGRLSFRTFCLTISSNTKENLVMTWLGSFSFHIAGSPRGMGWYRWLGLDMGREFEAEHTEIRSVRKPAARWLGASIPKYMQQQTHAKSSVTILTQSIQRNNIFRRWVVSG